MSALRPERKMTSASSPALAATGSHGLGLTPARATAALVALLAAMQLGLAVRAPTEPGRP
jgi:hypothetical protein